MGDSQIHLALEGLVRTKAMYDRIDQLQAKLDKAVSGLDALKSDYLDEIIGCMGEGDEFRAYNKGKSQMANWFVRHIDYLLAEINKETTNG